MSSPTVPEIVNFVPSRVQRPENVGTPVSVPSALKVMTASVERSFHSEECVCHAPRSEQVVLPPVGDSEPPLPEVLAPPLPAVLVDPLLEDLAPPTLEPGSPLVLAP
jgi:hypothetical protein